MRANDKRGKEILLCFISQHFVGVWSLGVGLVACPLSLDLRLIDERCPSQSDTHLSAMPRCRVGNMQSADLIFWSYFFCVTSTAFGYNRYP